MQCWKGKNGLSMQSAEEWQACFVSSRIPHEIHKKTYNNWALFVIWCMISYYFCCISMDKLEKYVAYIITAYATVLLSLYCNDLQWFDGPTMHSIDRNIELWDRWCFWWFFAAQPSPWLSCSASGNCWELEAQTKRIDGGAIEEEIRMVWGVLELWLVQTLLR